MHLLHHKSSPQELVLVDYDEDVADSRLSLTLAWPRNPTRGGVHRVQGLHEQVGGVLQSIKIRSRSVLGDDLGDEDSGAGMLCSSVRESPLGPGNRDALNAKK